jgi:hypothetical protein
MRVIGTTRGRRDPDSMRIASSWVSSAPPLRRDAGLVTTDYVLSQPSCGFDDPEAC